MTESIQRLGWRSRSDSMRAAKRRKLDAVFTGAHFRVVREIHLPPDKAFVTRFGNRGRHGYVIENEVTGEQIVVGNDLLKVIARVYRAVELPVRRRGRPPKNAAAG